MDNVLRPLVSQWREKIKLAMDYKKKEFQDDANVCMQFFNGPYDFMYGAQKAGSRSAFTYSGGADQMPKLSFQMTVNKVAEMVQLFGPVLYHRNPIRQVNARKSPMVPIELFGDPNDPMVQQQFIPLMQQTQHIRAVDASRAKLLEFYQNYTPNALDLKTNSRDCIDESIIKGMSVLWTELYKPPGSQMKMVGSFFDTVDNLCADPDGDSFNHAKWCSRRCVHPVWQVEDEYGLPRGSVKGNLESYNAQATVTGDIDGDYRRKQGITNDLLVYFKIYSKMGIGSRMAGVAKGQNDALDVFGDNVFLVICDTMDYPLNCPPDVIDRGDMQEVQQRLEWPTPFWADDSWPFAELSFHRIPGKMWPMSHLKPGMGELKFINWAYSFIAGKIKTASRDLIVIAKSVGEEVKTAVLSGVDYELIEIEKAHGTISEIVQFLQHPTFQGDIWRVIEAVEANFEKRVGLTELMYGSTKQQLRSASEANIKSDQLRVRPDDMANKVEDFMSVVARQEALAARWHLVGADVAPIMGPVAAQFWDQLVVPADPNEILHQLVYRIEAGSAKKPNKDRDAANMQQAMQTLFGPMMQYAMATTDFQAMNALIADWAKSIDLSDPEKYLFKPPQPPPMPGGQPPPGGLPAPGGARPAPGVAPPAGPQR